jgi:hypothetical protein
MLRQVCSWLLVGVLCSLASRIEAQDGRASLQLSPRAHKLSLVPELSLASSSVLAPTSAPLTDRNQNEVDNWRNALAWGAGATVGGLVGVIRGGRGLHCHDYDKRNRNIGWATTGAALSAVGIGLVTAAIVRLAHLPRGSEQSPMLAVIGVFSALATTGTWWVAGVPEWSSCISS